MRLDRPDAEIAGPVAVSVVSAVVAVAFAPPPWLSAPLVVVHLFLVPGYLFCLALFPDQDQLAPPERATLSIAASVGLLVVTGLVVEHLAGVTATTMAVGTLAVVAATAVAATVRGRARTPSERARPVTTTVAAARRTWAERDAVGGGDRATAAVIVAAAIALLVATVATVAVPGPGERYTELSVLGPDGTVDGLWGELEDPGDGTADVAIRLRNHEHSRVEYGVAVLSTTHDGAVASWSDVALGHGETWRRQIAIDAPAGGRARVDVLVVRDGTAPVDLAPDEAYRAARLSVNGSSGDGTPPDPSR